MPTYKGVEVWLEDSEKRKLNDEHVAIELVNDNLASLKARTKMHRDELYTIHCLTPVSIFCDVFVTIRSGRQCVARFHIDKNLSPSEKALGSSEGHLVHKYKDIGLRTAKRCTYQGKLIVVEVEIRRTTPVTKAESTEACAVDEDEDAIMFSMIDDFDRPPWLLFAFDVIAKGPPELVAVRSVQPIVKRVPRKPRASKKYASSTGGIDSRTCPGNKMSRPGQNLLDIPQASSSLQREYEEEEAEERRLLDMLLERLEAKRMSNMELRRLLGETA